MNSYANPFDPGSLHDYYLNSTPDAAFWEYLGGRGLTGLGNGVSRFAQGQQGRVYNKYQAHIANEPNLGFWDYLNREQPDLQADYQSLSPNQRGDSSNRFLQPRARFVNAY